MSDLAALIHEAEVTVCSGCGHLAVDHHGVDGRVRRDAGCQTHVMRDDWCRCARTCPDVMRITKEEAGR